MKNILAICLIVFFSTASWSQSAVGKFEKFGNPTAFSKVDPKQWQLLSKIINLSVVGFNKRVPYNRCPISDSGDDGTVKAWKGEYVNFQLVVSSKKKIKQIKVSVDNFSSGENQIASSENARVGFVYYVVCDNTRGVCKKKDYPYENVLMPDIIDFKGTASFVNANANRPVWIKVFIPLQSAAGTYKGQVTVNADGVRLTKTLSLVVSENALPTVDKRNFFLDLWQYPMVEADYYNVTPWSDKHFKLMEPAMVRLQNAGQKSITTSFFWDVFNPRVRDIKEMMIQVVKTRSGGWEYNFENFDKWVKFMMTLGIKDQITCFGIAPLNYRYYFYDQAQSKMTYFSQGVDGADYKKFWLSYLDAFEKHLKGKGWFEITALGIDEKEADVLTALISFIKGHNKDWKIAFTGKYFPEYQSSIYNYSVISNQLVPENIIKERSAKGFKTTFYTSCWEIFPNTFVMSDPIDATWLGWNAANRSMDGYLRYAYDYWGKSVLFDSRSDVAAGDRFLVYPDNNSSIRFEMLCDGVEDYEKVRQKKGIGMPAVGLRAAKDDVGIKVKDGLSIFDFKKVNAQKSREQQIKIARDLLVQ